DRRQHSAGSAPLLERRPAGGLRHACGRAETDAGDRTHADMIGRRSLLAGIGAFAAFPLRAEEARLTLAGTLEQGSLIVGRAKGAASVTVDGTRVTVSPEGLFAFGLSYDQTKAASVVARFADGKVETRDVVPVLRHYEIQHINGLPEKYVTPP